MIARLFTPIRIALLIGTVLSILRFQGCLYLHLTDVRAMDYRMLQRGEVKPANDVVIVAIDDASIEKIGRWPWPRSVLARLIERLSAAEPAVIGFDIVFSEPSAFDEDGGLSARPDGVSVEEWANVQKTLSLQDDLLGKVIHSSGRVVLGYFFDFEGKALKGVTEGVPSYNLVQGSLREDGNSAVPNALRAQVSLPQLTSAARGAGYFTVIPDSDGSIRRVPLVVRLGQDMALPLSLATLRVYRPEAALAIRFEDFGVDTVRFGTTMIPVAEDGQMLINYRGPGRTFRHVAASDVLAGKVAPESLRGRILLLGITATAVQDIRVTPFDAVFPGVEIHANVIDNILSGQFIRQPKVLLVLADIAMILVLSLLIGVAMGRLRGLQAAIMVVVLLGAYLIGSQQIYISYGLPLTVVYALLSISITYAAVAVEHYVTEEREKRKMRKALELYLSPSMARIVSEQPEKLNLGGDKRELTVFFSDIRGFTTISEGLAPEALVELLNLYLGEMTEIIFQHDGMLDKYIGDAVMAVWGAPLPQADHAKRACIATLEMGAKLAELNKEWQPKGWPKLAIGAGLNTGPMVFGNMGSAQHLSLTVMGDNVNLGSRLEGLTKMYGVSVIASEETVRSVGDDFVARELDLVRVKGKNLPARIFELLGTGNDRGEWSGLIERFNAALEAFRHRRWEEAQETFSAILRDRPTDGPSRLYMARCQAMLVTPPGPEWDGVTVMDTK